MMSQREPQVGQTVIATLADPDGKITITKWEWATVEAADDGTCPDTATFDDQTTITGASSAAYTPKAADAEANICLAAQVTYTDNIANEDGVEVPTLVIDVTEKPVQPSAADNTAPKFPDQDLNTAGDQSDETSRSVAENSDPDESIGVPVGAGDGDDDLLLYSMSGPDADSFDITRTNGQISTKAKLDYETKATYTVVVNTHRPVGRPGQHSGDHQRHRRRRRRKHYIDASCGPDRGSGWLSNPVQ